MVALAAPRQHNGNAIKVSSMKSQLKTETCQKNKKNKHGNLFDTFCQSQCNLQISDLQSRAAMMSDSHCTTILIERLYYNDVIVISVEDSGKKSISLIHL